MPAAPAPKALTCLGRVTKGYSVSSTADRFSARVSTIFGESFENVFSRSAALHDPESG